MNSNIRLINRDLIYSQNPELAFISSPLYKHVGPIQVLDATKSLNAGSVWEKTSEANGGGGTVDSVIELGGDSESPTSTLSSGEGIGESAAAFIDGGIAKEENEGEWKGFGNSITFLPEINEFPPVVENAWGSESLIGNNSTEHVPCGNFVETFTDLLLSTYADGRRLPDDGVETDSSGRSGGAKGGDGGSDYLEDSKNYWNSILNLVDSSSRLPLV